MARVCVCVCDVLASIRIHFFGIHPSLSLPFDALKSNARGPFIRIRCNTRYTLPRPSLDLCIARLSLVIVVISHHLPCTHTERDMYQHASLTHLYTPQSPSSSVFVRKYMIRVTDLYLSLFSVDTNVATVFPRPFLSHIPKSHRISHTHSVRARKTAHRSAATFTPS